MFFRKKKPNLQKEQVEEKSAPLFRDRYTIIATVSGIDGLTWSLTAKFDTIEEVKMLNWEFAAVKYAFAVFCHQTGQRFQVTDPTTVNALKYMTSYGKCPPSCINQFWAQTYLISRHDTFLNSGGATLLKQMAAQAEPVLMLMLARRAYNILKTGKLYAAQDSQVSTQARALRDSNALAWLKLRLAIAANPDRNISNLALQLLDSTQLTAQPQQIPTIDDLVGAASLALS